MPRAEHPRLDREMPLRRGAFTGQVLRWVRTARTRRCPLSLGGRWSLAKTLPMCLLTVLDALERVAGGGLALDPEVVAQFVTDRGPDVGPDRGPAVPWES